VSHAGDAGNFLRIMFKIEVMVMVGFLYIAAYTANNRNAWSGD